MYDYYPRESEISVLTELRDSYNKAREDKNYPKSDYIRAKLISSGFIPPSFEKWSETFENSFYRQERLNSRKDFKNHLSGKI